MKIRLSSIALALALPVVGNAAGIEWNGFGSAYLAKPLTKNVRPSVIGDKNLDAASLGLLGLNLHATVDNDVTASAQIVARTSETDAGILQAKWFYLTWTPMTDLHIKAGRQVYPLFMNSENADVRANLPFTRIPDEVTYLARFRHFDGLSADHVYNLPHDLKLMVAVQGGRAMYAENVSNDQRVGNDLVGINVGLTGGWWTASLHASRVGFEKEGALANYTAGIKAEQYNVLAQAELLHQDLDKKGADGGYALIGYKWRGFMPRYSYNWARSSGLVNGDAQTHDIGVNYQVSQRMVAKLDVQFSDINKEQGAPGFTRDQDAQGVEMKKDNASAVLLGVDFLF